MRSSIYLNKPSEYTDLSRNSNKREERFYHIIGPLLFGIVGFIIAASTMSIPARYISLYVHIGCVDSNLIYLINRFMMTCSYAGYAVSLSWVSNTITRPPSKRAVALALVNGFSQLGDIAGS